MRSFYWKDRTFTKGVTASTVSGGLGQIVGRRNLGQLVELPDSEAKEGFFCEGKVLLLSLKRGNPDKGFS